jgi:plastocyanin
LPGVPGLPAGDAQIVAGPGAVATTYATPAVTMPRGGSATFTNLDPIQHDVVSTQPGLFSTPLIGIGQSTPVTGVEALAPGSYGFYCSLHANMTGTLTVQ